MSRNRDLLFRYLLFQLVETTFHPAFLSLPTGPAIGGIGDVGRIGRLATPAKIGSEAKVDQVPIVGRQPVPATLTTISGVGSERSSAIIPVVPIWLRPSTVPPAPNPPIEPLLPIVNGPTIGPGLPIASSVRFSGGSYRKPNGLRSSAAVKFCEARSDTRRTHAIKFLTRFDQTTNCIYYHYL